MEKTKKNKYIHQSKYLALILRHKAKDFGLEIDPSGWIKVDDIINLKNPKKIFLSLDIIKDIVKNDEKGRYELSSNSSTFYIRAVQGHSIKSVSNEEALKKLNINEIFNFSCVVHGTYFNNWELIKKSGLNKMNRNAIHFSIGYKNDENVKSGMRNNCNVFIEINLIYAFFNGFEFFISKNNVILCSGNNEGFLPVEYFKKVSDKNEKCLFFCEYEILVRISKNKINVCDVNNNNFFDFEWDFKNVEKLNEICKIFIEKDLIKKKFIIVINENDENDYVLFIKENVENKKIFYPSFFIDYLIENEKKLFTSEFLKKVDFNNKNNNLTFEKLTKEIILDENKIKYYILYFNNYNENNENLESVDLIIFSSKNFNTLAQFNYKFNQKISDKINYQNFINKFKETLINLNIINKRIILCINKFDQDFIIKQISKFLNHIPKIFTQNLIILNSNDFNEINFNENYLTQTKNIFIQNYISTKTQINNLKIF
jgi:2'-phosphotransferase